MSEAKHTPLPWVKLGTMVGWKPTSKTFDAVADIYAQDGEDHDYFGPESDANRDFVLLACNTHYDLLTALEAMWEAFVPYSSPSQEQEEAIGLARAAIAKAKGETA